MTPNPPIVPNAAPPAVPSPLAGHDTRVTTLEIVISDLLRWGVLASTAVILVGMAITFFHHPDYFQSADADALHRLTSPTRGPHSLEDVFGGIRGMRGTAIEMAGLLCLIALPVMRVAFSIGVFAARKDRRFVILSSAVLLLLTVSFFFGRAE